MFQVGSEDRGVPRGNEVGDSTSPIEFLIQISKDTSIDGFRIVEEDGMAQATAANELPRFAYSNQMLNGVDVDSAASVISPIDQPLATGGLGECAALALINVKRQLHSMTHVPYLEVAADELSSLWQDLVLDPATQIALTPGSSPLIQETVLLVVHALESIHKGASTRVELYCFPNDSFNWEESLFVSYQGQVSHGHIRDLPQMSPSGRNLFHKYSSGLEARRALYQDFADRLWLE